MRSDNRKNKGFKVQIWQIVVLVLALIVVGLFYSVNVVTDAYTVKPVKIYEKVFENRLANVNDLTGGGVLQGNYDIWLHFKCPTNDMKLRHANEFEKLSVSYDATHWFANKLGDQYDDVLVQGDVNNIELLYRTHREATQVNNEWVLHNKASTDYFYRNWGY